MNGRGEPRHPVDIWREVNHEWLRNHKSNSVRLWLQVVRIYPIQAPNHPDEFSPRKINIMQNYQFLGVRQILDHPKPELITNDN